VRLAATLLVAACGDSVTIATTSAADAAPRACAVSLSGNLNASLASTADCATVELARGHRLLEFVIPIAAIDAPLALSFDLGVVGTTGLYTSETVHAWSARATQRFGADSICIYAGGSDTAPQGNFTLVLDAIDVAAGTAHGSARLVLLALTPTSIPCGPIDVEHVELSF
jgi:hypothetical protein